MDDQVSYCKSYLIHNYDVNQTAMLLQQLKNPKCYFYSPMDVMKRSHRFSYAAAFGTLAQLCATIVFDAKHAFNYDGPAYLKGFYYFFLSISLS